MRKVSAVLLMLTLASCANAQKKPDGDCVCASDSLADGKVRRIPLGTDTFETIPFEPAQHGVFIGNPTVLAVTVVKSSKIQLVFKTLKPGSTSVNVLNSTGETKYQQQFQVTSVDLVDLSNQLIELLKDNPNAKVKLVKDKVVLDGELLTVAQASRIAAILNDKRYSDHVLNLSRMSPQFFTDLATRAQEELKKNYPNTTVRVMNNQLWIEGKVETAEQSNRAAKTVSLLLPEALPADPLAKSSDGEAIPPRAAVQNMLQVGK